MSLVYLKTHSSRSLKAIITTTMGNKSSKQLNRNNLPQGIQPASAAQKDVAVAPGCKSAPGPVTTLPRLRLGGSVSGDDEPEAQAPAPFPTPNPHKRVDFKEEYEHAAQPDDMLVAGPQLQLKNMDLNECSKIMNKEFQELKHKNHDSFMVSLIQIQLAKVKKGQFDLTAICNAVNNTIYGVTGKELAKQKGEAAVFKTLNNVIALTEFNKPYSQLSINEGFHLHNRIKYGSFEGCGVTGCIHGESKVSILHSETNKISTIEIRNLHKGDYVLTEKGFLPVAFVVKSTIAPTVGLYAMNSHCVLTKGHPVFDTASQDWMSVESVPGVHRYSNDDELELTRAAEFVYDVVIPGACGINVNGVLCLALGHQINYGLAKHDVLGNLEYVTNILSKSESSEAIKVVFKRDPLTGWISGIELN
jgi:Hint-domain